MARRIKSRNVTRPEAVSIDGPGPGPGHPARRKASSSGIRRLNRKSGQFKKISG